MAGALVSPLISAPRLELPLRGLPIVTAVIVNTAGFGSSVQLSLGACFNFFDVSRLHVLKLSEIAWHQIRGLTPSFPDVSMLEP